jgi:hypothetical protein
MFGQKNIFVATKDTDISLEMATGSGNTSVSRSITKKHNGALNY